MTKLEEVFRELAMGRGLDPEDAVRVGLAAVADIGLDTPAQTYAVMKRVVAKARKL